MCSIFKFLIFSPLCDYASESKERSSSPGSPLRGNWTTALQFWSLAILLSLVGSRVSSLIVLEFSLRAVSAWASAGLVSSSNTWKGQHGGLSSISRRTSCVPHTDLSDSDPTHFHPHSCICLNSGCRWQRPRPSPRPMPVLPGLRPHLYSGLPPSGGSTQLRQLVPGSCSQLGTGKRQPRSVEPCGQTLPAT